MIGGVGRPRDNDARSHIGGRGALRRPHEEAHCVDVYREHLGFSGVVITLLSWDGRTAPFAGPPVEGSILETLREDALDPFQAPVSKSVVCPAHPSGAEIRGQGRSLLQV